MKITGYRAGVGGSSPLLGTKSLPETPSRNRRLTLNLMAFFGSVLWHRVLSRSRVGLEKPTKMSRRCHAAGVAIAVLLSACSTSSWTRTDTAWQIGYTAALAADAYTTSRIQYTPGIAETQPLARAVLGPQPSTSDTWQYFGTMAVSHYLIARALPERWRRWWQVGGVGLHGYHAGRNCEAWLCDDDPPPRTPPCPHCQPVK